MKAKHQIKYFIALFIILPMIHLFSFGTNAMIIGAVVTSTLAILDKLEELG